MASRQNKNNLLAGTLVIFALVSSVAIVAQLGGITEQFGKTTYNVKFPLSFGVPGLGKGSLVMVGGHEVGSVIGVDFDYDDEGRVVGHIVPVRIERDVVLTQSESEGPDVVLLEPLLGSQSSLDFVTLGPADGAVVPEGGT
ncbi:MAG: hypothetical protein AAGB34_10660, partial [Planctomycetota bacterium]